MHCLPHSRCGKYRVCAFCARVRQAHVADLAEKLFAEYGTVYLARFTPELNTKSEIERLKDAIKRQLDHEHGLWSIESGTDKNLLHINVLSHMPRFKQLKRAEYWQGQQAKNIRQLAAYMVKQSQIPPIEIYNGRQFGTWQSMKSALENKQQLPIIQAAQAENHTLSSFSLNPIYLERQAEIARMRANNRNYEDIANDHLPKLRAFVALQKGTINRNK